MTKSSNLSAIEKTTGKPWNEWVKLLDGKDAKDLNHRQIADLAYEELKDSLENAGWWAQSVAVAYEQHTGRRAPGQRSDGTYEISVNKTVAGSLDEAMAIWLKLIKAVKDFDSVKITKPGSSTATEKYRHWSCGLEDKSRVNADAYQKAPGKVGLTITHTKLASQTAQTRWKAYWQRFLGSI